MTQRIPSETIDYERYVDGLRGPVISEADLIRKIDDHVADVITKTGLQKGNIGSLIIGAAIDVVRPYLRLSGSTTPAKPITIHIEGGLVAEVRGIPAGITVRVEDYDVQNPGDDSWDAEKECVVTVYGGGAS